VSGLREALSLGSKEMVCLVGAGGKTSLLKRLARECPPDSPRLLVTTSTKMRRSELESCGPLVLEADDGALLRALTRRDTQVISAARALTPDGKALGLSVDVLDSIYDAGFFPLILVEADGARGQDLKAPGPGEPVIPSTATTVLAVVGVGVLGRPLADPRVHRPEHVASVAKQDVGSLITWETVTRVLRRYQVLCTEMAPRVTFVPIVNQADTPQRLEHAVDLADHLRSSFGRVIITATRQSAYVRRVLN
jgi:molybdenum cofactor cytidylyltransferase